MYHRFFEYLGFRGLVLYLFLLLNSILLKSQNQDLIIHTSTNDTKITVKKSFSFIEQIETNRDKWSVTDDSIFAIMPPSSLTNEIKISGFGFHLRPVDRFHSVKLNIRGYSTGKIREKNVVLVCGDNEITGNQANKNLKGKAWPEYQNSGYWTYYFNINPNFFDRISTDSFALKIQLENKDKDTINVVITDVAIEVNYYPVFSFCKDDIITFFVDEPGMGYEYNWELPEDARMTSLVDNNSIINIIFSGNHFGFKNINIEVLKDDIKLEGHKTISYNDCRISSIKGGLWIDNNCNSVLDSADFIPDSIAVNLTNSIDFDKWIYTDSSGIFNFDSLISDYYTLNFDLDKKYLSNSYLLNRRDDGLYSTGEFFLQPGYLIDSFSFAIVEKLNIGGNIWVDDNANTIRDSFESNVISGFPLYLMKDTSIVSSSISDSIGNFDFTGLISGNYSICLEENSGFLISGFPEKNCIQVNLECGNSIENFNLGLYKKGSISGNLWIDNDEDGLRDTSEAILPGVKVYLYDTSGIFIGECISDSLGKYAFTELKPGGYLLLLLPPDKFDITLYKTGNKDLDNDFFINQSFANTENIYLNSGELLNNIDCGFIFKKCSIGDLVWLDSDKDGQYDLDEPGIDQIKIILFDKNNRRIDETYSGSWNLAGSYHFENLNFGEYYLKIELPDKYKLTKYNKNDSLLNSDFDTIDLQSDIFELEPGDKRMDLDVGLVYNTSNVECFVWEDENASGLQDNNETGIEGIRLKIVNSESNEVEKISESDNLGTVLFENIKPGNYYIELDSLPERYKIAAFMIGQNADIDNDFKQIDSIIRTTDFELEAGDNENSYDLGLIVDYSKISGLVWYDKNSNGIAENDEIPLENMEIQLFDADYQNGNALETIYSGIDGKYEFEKVTKGNYFIKFLSGSSYFPINVQGVDNDIQETFGIGTTNIINIEWGNDIKNVNGAYDAKKCGIGDFVWLDINNNGLQDTGEPGISGIEVELYDTAGINIGQKISGQNGEYFFDNIESGQYYIIFKIDSLYNLTVPELNNSIGSKALAFGEDGITNVFDLKPGEINLEIDIGLVYDFATIGDKVWYDKNNNHIFDDNEEGIAGIALNLYNLSTGIVFSTVSDADGNYRIDSIVGGKYYLEIESIPDTLDYPLPSGNIADITGEFGYNTTSLLSIKPGTSIENLDFGLIPKSGAVGDLVWEDRNKNGNFDAGEKTVPGVIIKLFSETGQLYDIDTSDVSGRYSFSGLNAGNYYIEIENIPDTLSISQPSGRLSDITNAYGENTTNVFDVQAGQRILNMDFGLIKKKGSIGDFIWLDSNGNGVQDIDETGLNDIGVFIYDKNGIEIQQTISEEVNGKSGYYRFDVEPGEYILRFLIPFKYESTIPIAGNNSDVDSDLTGKYGFNTTDIVSVNANENRNDIDAGIRSKDAIVGGRVWIDLDEDGIMDAEERGLNDVKVKIYSEGELYDSTLTLAGINGNGYYSFNSVVGGSYYIVFDIGENYSPTLAHSGFAVEYDSDITGANGKNSTDMFLIYPGNDDLTINAGLIKESSNEISGRVWLDLDKDGLMDIEEEGINNVEVRLWNFDSLKVAVVNTYSNIDNGLDGYYKFENIPVGKYYVQFINQIGYLFTASDIGVSDSVDSDVLSIIDFGATDTIFIEENTRIKNVNAGFILDNHSAIGDKIWEDVNGNGLQDPDEPGIDGVLVQLYKKGEGVKQSVLSGKNEETGESGYYLFDNLLSGDYYIKMSLPGGFYFTKPNASNDESIDSDINDGEGINTTSSFHLGVNERKYDVDAGAYHLGEVGDYVWIDENENGVQDDGEEGLEYILLHIFNEEGVDLGTFASDKNGKYRSNSLQPGKYYLKVSGYLQSSFTNPDVGDDETDSDITNEFGAGTTSLFQILSGEFNKDVDIGIIPGTRISLMTYPNPVNDMLKLSFITMKSKEVKVLICDMKGEKIKDAVFVSSPGNNILKLDLGDMKAGLYNVILDTGKEIDRKLFLKVNPEN